VAGCCEHGNELWVSIIGWEFLGKLSNYQLINISAFALTVVRLNIQVSQN